MKGFECTGRMVLPGLRAEALELEQRTGGWWRPNILDRYCEYELARQMP
jgi:hypothetical protein